GPRVHDRLPRGGDADADRRNDPQTGDGDTAASHGRSGARQRDFAKAARNADPAAARRCAPGKAPTADFAAAQARSLLDVRSDVIDGLLHSRDLLGFLVGNLGLELLL